MTVKKEDTQVILLVSADVSFSLDQFEVARDSLVEH